MMRHKNGRLSAAAKLGSLLGVAFLFLCITVLITVRPVSASSKVYLSTTTMSVIKGCNKKLTLVNGSGTIKWSSSNSTVAAVSSTGKTVTVTGKKTGTATITAKRGTSVYRCKVTVKTLSIDTTCTSLNVGKTMTLTAANVSGTVYWTSSNTSVVSLTRKSSTKYVLNAKKAGTAIITVKNGSNIAKCQVTVKKQHVHSYKETKRVASTCISKGKITWVCSCGAEKTTELDLDPSNHKSIVTNTTKATCLVDGVERSVCNDCKKTIKSAVLKALGHAFDSDQAVATCSRCGVKEYNYVKTDRIVDLDFTGMEGCTVETMTEKANGYVFKQFKGSTFNKNGLNHNDSYCYPYCDDPALLTQIRNALTTGKGLTIEVTANMLTGFFTMGFCGSGKQMKYYPAISMGRSGCKDTKEMAGLTLSTGLPYQTTGSTKKNSPENAISTIADLKPYVYEDTWNIQLVISPNGEVSQYINGNYISKNKVSDSFRNWVFEGYPESGYSFERLFLFSEYRTGNTSYFMSNFRVYGRALTEDEIRRNSTASLAALVLQDFSTSTSSVILEKNDKIDIYTKAVPFCTEDDFSTSTDNRQVALASSTMINAKSAGQTSFKISGGVADDQVEQKVKVTVTNLSYPLGQTRTYTGIAIARKTDSMEVGEEYVCQAYAMSEITPEHPWNYCYYDENVVSYSSGNPSVCSVKNGVLCANAVGRATITVKAGTVSERFDVTVTEKTSLSYSSSQVMNVNVNFDTMDPQACTKGIQNILKKASSEGYRRVNFPKAEYRLSPAYGSIYMPSQMIVDFQGSTLQIVPGTYSTIGGYKMIIFENTEYTQLTNAVIYGERFLLEKIVTDGCVSVAFIGYNYRSGLKDCTISRSPGFNIGAGKGNLLRKAFALSRVEAGGLTECGEDRDEVYTFRSKGFLSMPTNSTRFGLGNMQGYQGYLYLSARMYNIYFFDADYKFISSLENCVQYYKYDRPENAVYCRISFHQAEAPTKCDGDFYSIAHIYAFDEPVKCYISGCTLEDNNSTAIAPNAGDSWVFEDCVFRNNGLRDPASHIDWEDGRNNNKGHILRNCYFEDGGAVSVIGADGVAIHNNIFKNVDLYIADEVQNSRVWLNQFIGNRASVSISTKTDMVFSQNYGSEGASCTLNGTGSCCMFRIWSAANSFEKYTDKTNVAGKSGHNFIVKETIMADGDHPGRVIYECSGCRLRTYEINEDELGADTLGMEEIDTMEEELETVEAEIESAEETVEDIVEESAEESAETIAETEAETEEEIAELSTEETSAIYSEDSVSDDTGSVDAESDRMDDPA